MKKERKVKTLHSRKGMTWTDAEFLGVVNEISSPKVRAPLSTQNELDFFNMDDFVWLDRMLFAGRESKARPYATSEDLRELKRRIQILENRLEMEITPERLGGVTAAVSHLISEMDNLEAIRKVSYRREEKNLDFFLVADQFSSDLLERISDIEIKLSRKFPNLSIVIEPILCDEKLPEESHIMFVRK